MSKVTYQGSSPYQQTDQPSIYLDYLDFWNGSFINPVGTDSLYTVQAKYDRRPDLLSYDFYQTTGYWWVFALRNPDSIKDPINDLKAGMTIYIPSANNLPGKSGA
jgi:hypothetical protein